MTREDLSGAAFHFLWRDDGLVPEATRLEMQRQPALQAVEPVLHDRAKLMGELAARHGITLSDADVPWTAEEARELARAWADVPAAPGRRLEIRLSSRRLAAGVELASPTAVVTISRHAFFGGQQLAAPPTGETQRRTAVSQPLIAALLHVHSGGGLHASYFRGVLNDVFGVETLHAEAPVEQLTAHTTVEDAGRFDRFKTRELAALCRMFYALPPSLRKTEGLRYLLRRKDGTPHPLHPHAPAVAWPSAGYVEFMESAFKDQPALTMERLILHEKAHFLWANVLGPHLKDEWIELGGWYPNENDPDGWSTSKQVEFVSAYAHRKNPDEDFAESFAYYVCSPDKLRSRSEDKLRWLERHVFRGDLYLSVVREDSRFEVLNLEPDFIYPGKIRSVEVAVAGAPEEDKTLTVRVGLWGSDRYDGASDTPIRITSPQRTFVDLWLKRQDERGLEFEGRTTLSKHVASGYWTVDQISFRDAAGLARHSGVEDFGWRMHVDSPLEDLDPPLYEPGTIRMTKRRNGDDGWVVGVAWNATDRNRIVRVSAVLNDENDDTYSKHAWGRFDPERGECLVEFPITRHDVGGLHRCNFIKMIDVARNVSGWYFTRPPHALHPEDRVVEDEEPPTITVHTSDPDVTPPELDLERISVAAEPVSPERPDGETIVRLRFRVRDDKSGFARGGVYLRDPTGASHWHWIMGSAVLSEHAGGWSQCEHAVRLAKGSIPGTWGVTSLMLRDAAGNSRDFDFTTLVRFTVKG